MSYLGNPINSVAFLTDQFSGNGSTTAFTMSVAPATTSSILVAVSGVVQDPTTYSVVGTTLTFSAAPPSGTGNVSVRYLGIPAAGVTTTAYRTITDSTATAGQTTFSIPSYTVGYLNVFQNGVRLGAADFTATNGTTVVLTVAAAAGDLITTESFYVSSVLNAIPATAGSVQQTYFAPNVAGNGPAFRAYLNSGNQSTTSTTNTKVALDTEAYDTANCFNNTASAVGGIPAYAFKPNVAGYYQFSASVYSAASSGLNYNYVQFYKNGSQDSCAIYGPYATTTQIGSVSALIYLNGTTDYVELYDQVSGSGTCNINAGSGFTFMTGYLARAA
jgi:hypothetical protein